MPRYHATAEREEHEDIPCYGHRKRMILLGVYILSFLLWGFIGWALQLYTSGGPMGFLIFLGPWVTFTLTIISLPYLNLEVESHLFRVNFLSLGLVVVIPLMGIMSKNYGGDMTHYLAILLAAIACSLLSLVDLWVGHRYLSISKHIKNILQQYSIFLLLFAIWLYYLHAKDKILAI